MPHSNTIVAWALPPPCTLNERVPRVVIVIMSHVVCVSTTLCENFHFWMTVETLVTHFDTISLHIILMQHQAQVDGFLLEAFFAYVIKQPPRASLNHNGSRGACLCSVRASVFGEVEALVTHTIFIRYPSTLMHDCLVKQ